ncbi:hypothetical protein Musp01_14270 [Muricauda sp. NBRC 101325]|nr:hypothetical protein Musp01_14270 [Muricauda sp. NBRC 101325]
MFTQVALAQIPGQSYYDNTGFVEYIRGDHPVIITVPHNGYLEPDNIPDRSCNGCKYGSDSHTQEMARTIIDAYFNLTGHYPHVIINLLARVKFDANRPIDEAADGNATVEVAWQNYQNFIKNAKSEIEQDYGRGILFDFHGHSHDVERVELGYTLTNEELAMAPEVLNSFDIVDGSGIKSLILDNPLQQTHTQMLIGPYSLGALIQQKGYPTVPSPDDHYPLANEEYFTGGFTIFTHSSRRDNNSAIDGIQIEVNRDIRFDETVRTEFSIDLADAIFEYLNLFYLSDVEFVDADQDGFNNMVDCDDTDPSINPNADEILDNDVDENCDGKLGTSTIEPPNPFEPTDELFFYPNPTDELLLIINANSMNFYVEFFDTSGKLVYKVVNQKELHLEFLASGQYIVVYHDLIAGKAIKKKILVK